MKVVARDQSHGQKTAHSTHLSDGQMCQSRASGQLPRARTRGVSGALGAIARVQGVDRQLQSVASASLFFDSTVRELRRWIVWETLFAARQPDSSAYSQSATYYPPRVRVGLVQYRTEIHRSTSTILAHLAVRCFATVGRLPRCPSGALLSVEHHAKAWWT